jgi:hypothetical protein
LDDATPPAAGGKRLNCLLLLKARTRIDALADTIVPPRVRRRIRSAHDQPFPKLLTECSGLYLTLQAHGGWEWSRPTTKTGVRAFAASDPAATTGTARMEIGKMLAGLVRARRLRCPSAHRS